jgi:hypothetical protein
VGEAPEATVRVVRTVGEREPREIPESDLEDYLGRGWEVVAEGVALPELAAPPARPAILTGTNPKARKK